MPSILPLSRRLFRRRVQKPSNAGTRPSAEGLRAPLLVLLLCGFGPAFGQRGGAPEPAADGERPALEDLMPAAEWSFESAGALDPTPVRWARVGETWLLLEMVDGQPTGQRYLPYGIPELGLPDADEMAVSGTLGAPPAHIRLMGQPLRVEHLLPLQRAAPDPEGR